MDNAKIVAELVRLAKSLDADSESPWFDSNSKKTYYELGKLLGSVSATARKTAKNLQKAASGDDADAMGMAVYDVLDELDYMENEIVKARGRLRGLQSYVDREEMKRQ